MGMPSGIQVIDTMMGLPGGDRRWWTRSMAPLLLDAESQRDLDHAAGYMYKDLPETDPAGDPVETLLGQMDAFGIDIGMIPVTFEDEPSRRALAEHGNRLVGSFAVDPNRGMEAVRSLRRAVDELGVVAASFFPCGCVPQVPINDKRAYPVYACCVDLDIPIFINAGVPGPRVPMGAQKVSRVDEVCWFFPDLRIVLRHGGEPWEKAGGEADGQVAQSVLLDQRVRSALLPEGDHRLRQHSWRRPGALCRLLPLWTHPRTILLRIGGCPVP